MQDCWKPQIYKTKKQRSMPVKLLYIEGLLVKKKSEQISVQKSDLGKTGRAELGISGQQDLRLPTIW